MCRNLLTNDSRKQYVQPFEYIKLRFSSWNIQGTEKDAPKASLLLLDVTIWIFSTLKICVPKDYSLTLFTRNVIAASPGSLKKCCWEQCNIVLIEIFTKTRKSKCSNYKINTALSHLGSFQQRRSLLTQTGAIPALNEVKLRSSRELQCLKMRHCFSVETPLKQIKRVNVYHIVTFFYVLHFEHGKRNSLRFPSLQVADTQVMKRSNLQSLFDPKTIEIKSFETGPLMFGMDFKEASNLIHFFLYFYFLWWHYGIMG